MTQPEQSITFVIGAGASNEVNMPTGYGLKATIARALEFKVDDFGRLAGGDRKIREAIYQLAQSPGNNGDVNAYIKAALLIKDAMPQAPSIDNFIDSHRADRKIAECGKLAIASEILKAERASKLFVDPNNSYNKLKFENLEDTWFSAFFQLLALNTQLEEIPQRLSCVKIVSFNYDRTLEHFLHQAIQNYYGCSSEAAAKALDSLVILHPYGSVGALPWQQTSTNSVLYGGDLDSNSLLSVASSLRTFTEGTRSAESQINQIRSAVLDADTLVFLGFAYLELNLELLFGLGADGPVKHLKKVYGTAMGLSESNKKAIAIELANLGKYDTDQIILRRELSAAQVFPEYSRSLRF
ncbi:hypothetical protein [Undibacterium sp.]|uniref:hypothetical protein n=1 Tax=Undibacterium sp. TaxID=1914977 RepID=UPI0025E6DF82|nr:hypothetical protein [Undibacterium sp.]